MKNVIETCTPRESIVKGSFNPEVFTAALMPVIEYYRTGRKAVDEIYTDGVLFFRDATYPTEGLTSTITNVFRRISGDGSAPSIYRAETGFGGGKTHMLIGCTHIAERGKELESVTKEILPAEYLPEPHSVIVVGVAGDQISVRKTKGSQIVPHTLWGEIAYQVGGEDLYNEVKEQAEAQEAPGKDFLDKVLGDKKVLIMLDEMAQYAVRVDVAQKNGAANLAAFLMLLYNYAKSHTGIVVILTLAGSNDAFGDYTELLKSIQEDNGVDNLTVDDVAAMSEKANKDLTSVTMRDATGVTPVSASEISSVLAKRLFTSIDTSAAAEIADAYHRMYATAQDRLPEEACRQDYRDRIEKNYPFHPTLIDFLNKKLALAENFQGTRGVLRVLAMTIRSIWNNKTPVLNIHASDIDMHNNNLVSELLGKTRNAELKQVLTADVGSEDSNNLAAGMSIAQSADKRNPHPDHIPMYENTWKVVFLNSLVGRSGGQTSNVFGINEKDAIFMVATPLLTPPQVEQALKEIPESAYYLRFENGKYFAAIDPTINSVLGSIRRNVTDDQVRLHLRSVTNRMISSGDFFEIIQNVKYPQDVPDNRDKPLLCVVSLDAGSVSIEQIYTYCGSKPRTRQNSMVLLVPKTVQAELAGYTEQISMGTLTPAEESWKKAVTLARQVIAIKLLKDSPASYGIPSSKLHDPEFVSKEAERNNALSTMVNSMYTTIWFPTSGNHYERKELHASGSEGSAGLIEQIIQALKDAGELVSAENTKLSDLESLSKMFFENKDYRETKEILNRFYTYRTWPILTDRNALLKILNEGVNRELWIAYKMPEDPEATRPAEIYTGRDPVPMSVSLLDGYSIVTVAGAKKRGWLDKAGPEQREVYAAVTNVLSNSPSITLHEMREAVHEALPLAKPEQIDAAVSEKLKANQIGTYSGTPDQQNKPDTLRTGMVAIMNTPSENDVLITAREQSERGWMTHDTSFTMEGQEAKNRVLPLLKRLSSLYTRGGAKTVIKELDVSDMTLPSGGKLRLTISDAGPDDLKNLGELFSAFMAVSTCDEGTEVSINIKNPDEQDALIKELKGKE